MMTVLKDALYNLNPDSGTSPEYAKGILVGAMSALMEVGRYEFHQAVKGIVPFLPSRVMRESVPLAWRGQFSVAGAILV